jgi:hypothetical protein
MFTNRELTQTKQLATGDNARELNIQKITFMTDVNIFSRWRELVAITTI